MRLKKICLNLGASMIVTLPYKGHVIEVRKDGSLRVFHGIIGNYTKLVWGPISLSVDTLRAAVKFIDREFEKYELW